MTDNENFASWLHDRRRDVPVDGRQGGQYCFGYEIVTSEFFYLFIISPKYKSKNANTKTRVIQILKCVYS